MFSQPVSSGKIVASRRLNSHGVYETISYKNFLLFLNKSINYVSILTPWLETRLPATILPLLTGWENIKIMNF